MDLLDILLVLVMLAYAGSGYRRGLVAAVSRWPGSWAAP